MSELLPILPVPNTSTVIVTRTPASGACKCARQSCWHQRQCRSNGAVRILRAAKSNEEVRKSVVLCRECAAPSQRHRVA
jgi:hypothetical protein